MTLAAGPDIKEILGHQTVGWKLQCRTELKQFINFCDENYSFLFSFSSVIIKNQHIIFISAVFS